jgi:hypothetical protein
MVQGHLVVTKSVIQIGQCFELLEHGRRRFSQFRS